MSCKPSLILMLALASQMAATSAHAEAAVESNFQSELKSILARGLESKRGIVFHLSGEEVPGVVKRILTDAVLVSNQEHSTILIRLDRIDAIEVD